MEMMKTVKVRRKIGQILIPSYKCSISNENERLNIPAAAAAANDDPHYYFSLFMTDQLWNELVRR